MSDITIVGLALLILAGALIGAGMAGLTERLPRNRWIGLRIPSVRANDAAWMAGHRAAGSSLVLAAIPPLVIGAALLVDPPAELEDWLLFLAVAGVVTGGLIALAVRRGDRAAQEVTAEN